MTSHFKIITYKCKCRYIQIADPEKQIMKNFIKCPVHGRLKENIELFCLECGTRIIMTNFKAAAKRKRCLECGKRRRKKKAEASQENYKGRYMLNQEIKYTEKETQKDEKKRQINAWYNHMRAIFRPPVLEGIC